MKILATDREGKQHVLDSKDHAVVMQVLRENGLVTGDCDGSCSCATCHVYLTDGWFEKLSGPSGEEVAVLDTAVAVEPSSRLSCQIPCGAENDGIALTVAPA